MHRFLKHKLKAQQAGNFRPRLAPPLKTLILLCLPQPLLSHIQQGSMIGFLLLLPD
jgi:hypothetical protein